MDKIFKLFKQNWQFLIVAFLAFVIFFSKIKDFFKSIFNPDARESAQDNSGSSYLGSQQSSNVKGIIVGSDGVEYFRYGSKKVRLTDANKARVVQYVTLLYDYLSVNTSSIYEWVLDDNLHFYTSEIADSLNDYNSWCQRQETWLHFFAYIFLELHNVEFLEYVRCSLSPDDYEVLTRKVTNLAMFYY